MIVYVMTFFAHKEVYLTRKFIFNQHYAAKIESKENILSYAILEMNTPQKQAINISKPPRNKGEK